MKTCSVLVAAMGVCLLSLPSVSADEPSAFGSGFDVQEFYKPFTLDDITPANMQKWPYYKYVSTHWDEYSLHGTRKIKRSNQPTKLTVAEGDQRFDLNQQWKEGESYIDAFLDSQVKGFVVMKDNQILAEFYDNGFMVDQTQLLQSSSKTLAGVITNRLINDGLLDPNAKVQQYMKDFEGTDIGGVTIQHVLDMTSGLPTLLDYHTAGASGQLWEIEIGLQPGKSKGHRDNLKAAKAQAKQGDEYNYSDKNTDVLGLLAEQVSGKKYGQLLSELFDAFGANSDGSIALTSDGTGSANYGVSITARDYALFHQWIARRQASKCFYDSALDTSKTRFGENKSGQLLSGDDTITYGSQSYFLGEYDVLYSSGSYGQFGFSDMKTGVSVVFMHDWAVNAEPDKLIACRARALEIIKTLRSN
ncbi:6-aminohexanoate-dimer hydrolase [Planctomycetes bacterium CA13]|uniref:6-aminohexanoate-dimer hydrolase n=1 Tax=Novipirellula herctigrandis TaxID=2527986 RepID=A0A5C5ZBM6_9BACT|nr:6-aminohexanoate-dimer hydrolase [Planctomycetes bacterium CA13]